MVSAVVGPQLAKRGWLDWRNDHTARADIYHVGKSKIVLIARQCNDNEGSAWTAVRSCIPFQHEIAGCAWRQRHLLWLLIGVKICASLLTDCDGHGLLIRVEQLHAGISIQRTSLL